MMTPDVAYPLLRRRMIDLAATIDEAGRSTPVPALPGWTVRDTYGHVAAGPTDILDGFSEQPGTPQMTARQIDERRDRSLESVCEEWERRGREFDPQLAEPGCPWKVVVFDAWHHEQDIAGALGLPADRAGDVCALAARLTAKIVGSFFAAGAPSIKVVATDLDGGEWRLGDGELGATVRGTHYELARMLMARRSREQVFAFDWEGDPQLLLEQISLFTLPESNLDV